jgi:hypothetical protein
VPTNYPDDPQFAGVRGDLARFFVQHKTDMGMADASDTLIIANVNNIAAALYFLSLHALDHGDETWLARHEWFRAACGRLDRDQPAVKLDS